MASEQRRVVVTGMGVVTPVGIGVDTFWESLIGGVSGVGLNDRFDCSAIGSHMIAQVRDFDPTEYMTRKEAHRTDRFVHFAIASTQLAVRDSGIPDGHYEPERTGVYIGTGVGGMTSMVDGCRTIFESGMGKVSPFVIPMMLPNMAVGHIARIVQAKGPTEAIVTACASSTNALGDAYRMISNGLIDLAYAGGTEAAINPISIASFANMRGISKRNGDPERASRPFDKDRDGFVPSEGAGMLVLEALEGAQRRGATIYGEIIGYGMSNDAYDAVQPSPGGDGAARAMRHAIRDAGLAPSDIDYINPHATSTPQGDAAENAAIKSVFGDHAYDLAISATKSMTGHMIGAAGAIEAVSTLKALTTSTLPPTINLDNPDVDCDLNYIPHKAITRRIQFALSNSFGFGGHNATVVLAKVI